MVLDGTGSVYDDTGLYLVSISLYCMILGGTGSAKGLYACIYLRRWRFGRVTPMPDRHIHRQQNIGLVYSKKLKLSHAKRSTFSSRKVIINKMIFWFVLNVLCKKKKASGSQKSLVGTEQV